MAHLTELQLSMYADGALEPGESMIHLDSCISCQSRSEQYVAERRIIDSGLQLDNSSALPDFEIPAFSSPASFSRFAIANVTMGFVVWSAQFLWKSLFEGLVVETLSWFAIPIPDVYGLMVSITQLFSEEGITMIDNYFFIVMACILVPALTLLLYSYRKARSVTLSVGALLIAASLVAPGPVNALEFRHDEDMVTIGATEVIDDTAILTADTIVVEGVINGDLIALGRRIIVSGSIAGNLITLGEVITINAQVGGSAIGAAESYEIEKAVIKGDLWGAAESVKIGDEAKIGRNVTAAGEKVSISGRVEKDLRVFAEMLEVEGIIGRNLDVFTERLKLLSHSHIMGNVNFHTNDEGDLTRSSGSRVDGEVKFIPLSDTIEPQNRYLTISFYVHQLLWMASAFIAGLVLLWLVPALRDLTMGAGMEGLKTIGIGLVVLISLPVIALLVGITVIGLPFTVVGIFSWLLMIYCAKIVLASVIGRLLLDSPEEGSSLPLTLLAGLGIITVAVNIPAIGGILNFLLTTLGVGMIVLLVLDYTYGLSD